MNHLGIHIDTMFFVALLETLLTSISCLDFVALEYGLLHIARNERFVEISDESDSVLSEQSLRHVH